MLLQRGVAAGLSLLEVASLMCRGDEDEVPSELERLWTQAERLAYSALHNHRLRGCSDSFSSAPASRGSNAAAAQGKGAAARASSPSAAPGVASAAAATAGTAGTAEEDDLSAVSTAEDTAGETTPPKKPAPSTPRGGGHRRTASGDVALARTLTMGSPK